jgi:protein-S-isoprenylcysteine O-methyltransferase Ste14
MTYRPDAPESAISASPMPGRDATAPYERLPFRAFWWLTLAAIVILAIGFVFWYYAGILYTPRPPRGQVARAVNEPARRLMESALFLFASDIPLFLIALAFSIAFLTFNSRDRSSPATKLIATAAVALLVSAIGAFTSFCFTFLAFLSGVFM